jgi:catechol 2,3-dioxygenase-like lactoylglutathione lyase family enzyme
VFDHVTIRVSDLETSGRFYGRLFELLDFPGPPTERDVFVEWNDFSISQTRPGKPLTRRVDIGFAARSHEQVDEWWRALTAAGYPSDGEPGPRPEYGRDHYGPFVLDPDGTNVEVVFHDR